MSKGKPASARALIVEIIASSLEGIPSLEWVIERARNKPAALVAVAEYLHDYSSLRKGVYLSSDKAGVLLMYNASVNAPIVASFVLKLKLLVRCVGIRRAILVLQRSKYIHKHHPRNRQFLHVQYFGVKPGTRGIGSALELKNLVENKCREMNLPAFLETTQEQNRRVYERYGFRVFHEFQFKNSGFTTWMMRKENNFDVQ